MDSLPTLQNNHSYFSRKNIIIAIMMVLLVGICFGVYRWYQIRQIQDFNVWYAQQQQQQQEVEIADAFAEFDKIPEYAMTDEEFSIAAKMLQENSSLSEAEQQQSIQESLRQLEQVETEKRNQAMIEFKKNQ